MILISRVDQSGLQTKGLIKNENQRSRFPCEVCGDYKVVCSIQVFFKKDGELFYARARHYGADKFHYHQQSIEYINKKLRDLFHDPDQNN
jgi:hypothetical protein